MGKGSGKCVENGGNVGEMGKRRERERGGRARMMDTKVTWGHTLCCRRIPRSLSWSLLWLWPKTNKFILGIFQKVTKSERERETICI